jgi:SAM-dependent methyltransferase
MKLLKSIKLQQLILKLAENKEINILVGIGSNLEADLIWAARYFQQVFGIERSEDYYQQAAVRLVNVRNVKVTKGNFSGQFREVLGLFDAPALLILDSYTSLSGVGFGPNILTSLGWHDGDILIIDNAHILTNAQNTLHGEQAALLLPNVIDTLRSLNPLYRFAIYENALVAVPESQWPLLESELLKAESDVSNSPVTDLKGLEARLSLRSSRTPLADIHNFNQLSRNYWVAERAAEVMPGSKVIDIGAGTCLYRNLFSHCEYVSHDFLGYDGYRDNNEGQYGQIDIQSDITSIPVPDASFDIILCTEVLEHVPEPILALKEMARIVKPGGRLLITAPLGSGLHQLPYHYYGGFSPEWYKKFFSDFGCQIYSITPNGGFFKLLAQECARFAWTMDDHRAFHGADSELLGHLFGDLLPRYLFAMDDSIANNHFTVGYHVEAVKNIFP